MKDFLKSQGDPPPHGYTWGATLHARGFCSYSSSGVGPLDVPLVNSSGAVLNRVLNELLASPTN